MVGLLSTAIMNSAFADDFTLSNGYVRLAGRDGVISKLQCDPSGRARYGRNILIRMCVCEPAEGLQTRTEISADGSKATIHGAQCRSGYEYSQSNRNYPEELKPGHSLGQEFEWKEGFLTSVAAGLPTYYTSDSAVTMTLYRIDGNSRTAVASKRLENLHDGGWPEMNVPVQPAGHYLIEISDVKGKAGWWSIDKDQVTGDAQMDGQAFPGIDRTILCRGYRVVPGDYEISLDKGKITSEFVPNAESKSIPLETNITIPWVKSGYDTTSDRIIFSHFTNNRGQYIPVHQFKRRPISSVSGEELLMSGRFGADLEFHNVNISMSMSEDEMVLRIPGGKQVIDVLPHSDKLPDAFPQFYTSDSHIDKTLNEFLLSHNFNFGVGTNPDWKEWQTLQLSWTPNPQADVQRLQFLSHSMDPNGYVYCWGSSPGWPFPFKDDNKDGVNDYDTRHFTTNPCFILGAWREYCWNPEPEYLAKIMPRVRAAMNFMLKDVHGEEGLLTITAPGHEGRHDCIGSNYWDILPFGYKDAFTNAHFYPALEAMAQLEEAVLRTPGARSSVGAGDHTPYYYRTLAAEAKKNYNDTFWLADKGRYSSCVDIDGVVHDYGHTFVNLTAAGYDLANKAQVEDIYRWMENGVSSSGKRDIYSRWIFAPRSSAIHNPKVNEPQSPISSWWHFGWGGTDYDGQCQDGGAILYISYYDIIARARYLGADNAWKRFTEILNRYSKPDHLSGGSPLYLGEATQGGPGGSAGSVGVEGEFPESGLVPVSFLYAFVGIDADINGLKIHPNLPSCLQYAGVKNLRYAGRTYDIRVTRSEVEVKCTMKGHENTIHRQIVGGEAVCLTDAELTANR